MYQETALAPKNVEGETFAEEAPKPEVVERPRLVPVPVLGVTVMVPAERNIGFIENLMHWGNPGASRQEIADYVNHIVPGAACDANTVASEVCRFRKKLAG